MRRLTALLLLLAAGCSQAALPPPRLEVVGGLGGLLGMYDRGGNVIYLAPGANEGVLRHELNHWLGSKDDWYEVYR